jgi:hypothetical protein
MPFGETKVYFDGSHYISIPHTARTPRPRTRVSEETIAVAVKEQTEQERGLSGCGDAPVPDTAGNTVPKGTENKAERSGDNGTEPETVWYTTRKELFNRSYDGNLHLSKSERRNAVTAAMRPHFSTDELAAAYVKRHTARKLHNLIARRVRCTRKANLGYFNYFVTFTYDGKLHTENSFRKRLKTCLCHFCRRKGWKYIGVWERSPEKKRLHFHGIFEIPYGTVPGILFEKNDYNFNAHKRQTTVQNTYFNARFGRSDFETIGGRDRLGDAVSYILKYIEKTGRRIVYSKGLPQFFISDIADGDVVCRIGQEDRKLLLYDDFLCMDGGVLIGKVSRETIRRLRVKN